MKVALIGGTGFLGAYIVDELISQGHLPVLLVRPGSEPKIDYPQQCVTVVGEVADADAIRRTLDGCEAAIYNVGILREFRGKGITFQALHLEGAQRVMDIALELGVRRFLLTSANGAKPDGTAYQKTKHLAEQYLRTIELDWTVFRPSVIYGPPRGRKEFVTELRDKIIRSPLPAPLFYEGLLPLRPGSFVISPIHAKDVAMIYAKSLTMPQAIHQTYPLCGPDPLEWRTLIQTVARASGTHKLALPAPALALKPLVFLFEQFEFFPITQDHLQMLMEGNTCDSWEVFELFGIEPISFNEASLYYLQA
ncbi:MAG: SDR family oxidoreductase [Gammaproteobacteria bacterium]